MIGSSGNDSPLTLEGIAHVRKRPGMYVGGTDLRALHHMVYEILDNSAEEAYIDRCTEISLALRPNQEICIQDNSEGLLVGMDEESGKNKLQVLLTQFVSKEQFDADRPTITGGLHGVGLAAVNALSEYFVAEIRRDGYLWRQRYAQGMPQSDAEQVRLLKANESTGNQFVFRPDFSIMDQMDCDYMTLRQRCQELAYLIGNLAVTITDQRNDQEQSETFYSEKGLLTLLQVISSGCDTWLPPFYVREEVKTLLHTGKTVSMGVEVALQFTDCHDTVLQGYSNTVQNSDGGTHITGLKAGIVAAINQAFYQEFEWRDIAPGIRAAVSVRHPDPQFQSPTKMILGNPEVFITVVGYVYSAFLKYLQSIDYKQRNILKNRLIEQRS